MSGTLVGPAFGPFIGGIIVTFKSWRDIFWLQSALGGLATVLVVLFLPETIHYKKVEQLKHMTHLQYTKQIWEWTNPLRVIKLYKYPNLLIVVSNILKFFYDVLLTHVRASHHPLSSGTCTPCSHLSATS